MAEQTVHTVHAARTVGTGVTRRVRTLVAVALAVALLAYNPVDAGAQEEREAPTDLVGTDYSLVAPGPGDWDDPSAPPALPDNNIVGGQPIAISEFPSMVQLFVTTPNGVGLCAGNILRSNWIVTAAHCVDTASSMVITAGSSVLSQTSGQQRTAAEIIVHGGWDPTDRAGVGSGYDIALVRLNNGLNFNQNVQPVLLASPAELGAANFATITGWGLTGTGQSVSNDLLGAVIPVLPDSFCASFFEDPVPYRSAREICGDEPGSGTCNGDSGGPLSITVFDAANNPVRKLAGITSWSPKPCSFAGPGVYAEVPFFQEWIFANLPTRNCDGKDATVDLALGMSPTDGRDIIVGTSIADKINGKRGNDLICAFDGEDNVLGGPDDDVIFGGSSADLLKGNGGRDLLYGEGGPDDLRGGGGPDRVFGGNGADLLNGGKGIDTCNGGSGVDTHKTSCDNQVS